ncbi:MAG: ABC transporter permease [Leucobacter sp.]
MNALRTTSTRYLRLILIGAWLPAGLVGLWWWVSENNPSPFFPPLSKILERFVTVWLGEGFVSDILPSMSNLLIGFGLGVLLGLVFGIVIALLPLAEIIVNPYLQFLRALPSIALIPLLLMVMGTSDLSKIVLIAYGSFWPVLLNTIDGVKAIAPEVRQTGRSYRITPGNFLFRIILPGMFPQASIGIRLSLSIALVLVIGSEFYGATRGIGHFVLEAKQTFRLTDMWSGVILLGILGYLLTVLYDAIDRRLLGWRKYVSG